MGFRLRYDGLEGSGEWCEEDQCFHGRVVGIRDLVTYEGQDYEQLKEEFVLAVDDWRETIQAL